MQPEGYAERRRLFLVSVNDALDNIDMAIAAYGRNQEETLAALDNATYSIANAVAITRLAS